MAFKIVGVDENSYFPERVEDRLKFEFAEKTDLDDYASKDVETIIETGRLSEDSVKDTIVSEIVDEKTRFDFLGASVDFVASVDSMPYESRVMQSIGVNRSLNGEIWYSQVSDGSTGSLESTRVIRTDALGGYVENMVFTDAGHGTGVFVEHDSSGQIWVWLTRADMNVPTDQVGRYMIIRVPWSPNTVMTHSASAAYRVPLLSRATYGTVHYDPIDDVIGWREELSASVRFTRYTRVDVIANNNNVIDAFEWTPPSDLYSQGYALLAGEWYQWNGTAGALDPYRRAEVWHISTEGVVTRRDMEFVRNVSGGREPVGFSEPEGIGGAVSGDGRPSLVFGLTVGPTGARGNLLYALHMGSVPTNEGATSPNKIRWNSTWNDSAFQSLAPGVSYSKDERFNFRGKIENGKSILQGRINGTFTAGNNNIGTLRPGYYPAGKIRQIPLAISSAGGVPTVVRGEIGIGGGVTAYLPTGASSGFVDFLEIPIAVEG